MHLRAESFPSKWSVRSDRDCADPRDWFWSGRHAMGSLNHARTGHSCPTVRRRRVPGCWDHRHRCWGWFFRCQTMVMDTGSVWIYTHPHLKCPRGRGRGLPLSAGIISTIFPLIMIYYLTRPSVKTYLFFAKNVQD